MKDILMDFFKTRLIQSNYARSTETGRLFTGSF